MRVVWMWVCALLVSQRMVCRKWCRKCGYLERLLSSVVLASVLDARGGISGQHFEVLASPWILVSPCSEVGQGCKESGW
jgi:hypothetical protein